LAGKESTRLPLSCPFAEPVFLYPGCRLAVSQYPVSTDKAAEDRGD
jgi:hypothetical protein